MLSLYVLSAVNGMIVLRWSGPEWIKEEDSGYQEDSDIL